MAVKGLKNVVKELKKFGAEAERGIDAITEATANEITLNAKTLVPKNTGKLAQSIVPIKVADANYKVVVGLKYGVYVEFGTGNRVSVPQELKSLALQFKGKGEGSFEDAIKAIQDYLTQKGEPNTIQDAKTMFYFISQNGIKAQPYLYPSWVKGRKQYVKDMEHYLNTLTKKYSKK